MKYLLLALLFTCSAQSKTLTGSLEYVCYKNGDLIFKHVYEKPLTVNIGKGKITLDYSGFCFFRKQEK